MTTPLYVETSALLRAVLEGDDELATAIGAAGSITSALTFVEAARSLARGRREGRLDEQQAAVASRWIAAFERSCHTLALDESVLHLARSVFPVEPVRSLDALHLASIQFLEAEFGGIEVASCDDRVRRNVLAWGLRVLP